MVQLAAPAAAAAEDLEGSRPLHHALAQSHNEVARCLLAFGDNATELLYALVECGGCPGSMLPLYADVAARLPLTPDDWELVPAGCCQGLGAALPAVLARSPSEAAQLVARLTEGEKERLRTAALCLARAQRTLQLDLPPPLLRRLLASIF